MNNKKTILVTGSHRSGTTWAGNILASAPQVAYIHEPFNINPTLFNPLDLEYWFEYVCEYNETNYCDKIESLISFNYPLANSLEKKVLIRDVVKIYRNYFRFSYFRLKNYRPIVKDPIAIFSASWLAQKFDTNVLVMIRHPAAFCSSVKLKGWEFDFSCFLKQPLLMEHYLKGFEAQIREQVANKNDVISQAALLWNCIHHVIGLYQKEHPEWLFVKHEDLSLDPIAQFQKIYQSFNLEFTKQTQSLILASSGEHNPVEQEIDNEFVRNSKANIVNWKNRLDEAEIQFIKDKTCHVAKKFYDESDW